MKKYRLTAKERINGVSSVEGLRALDGYLEKTFEVSDEECLNTKIHEVIDSIHNENPDKRFVDFECVLMEE